MDPEAEDDLPTPDEDEVFNVEKAAAAPKPKKKPPPPYRVYPESKIPVSKAMGKMWRSKFEAAKKTYEHVYEAWNEVYKYYNHYQTQQMETPRGVFRRGDSTENLLFSSMNVLLPAMYGKNPEFTCSTTDSEDEDFCQAQAALITTLFKRRDKLNAKPKVRRALGFSLMTNCGVLKLGFNGKDDSAEVVAEQLQLLTGELEKAKTPQEIETVYGQLEALESQMEVAEPSGFTLSTTLPHKLIIDPYAEQSDALDAQWMAEEIMLPTGMLKAKFTLKDEDDENVLVFKPTHKISVSDGANTRDDGLGMVLEAISIDTGAPTQHTEEERLAYIYRYYTECVQVWDKTTRRLYLFLKDDWTWPIWVWSDPLGLSRFFPYFIVSHGMNTGRSTGVGEMSHVLDQQDELNDINRQRNRVRRAVFDFFFYNSTKITPKDAEALVKALRGQGSPNAKHAVGVKLEEGQKISDVFEAVAPPSLDYEQLFDRAPAVDTANRMMNVNDAIRGTQFKVNTTVPAVETYQEAAKLSIEAKVDPLEDTLADLGCAIGELAVTRMSQEEVEGLIGKGLAKAWRPMSVKQYLSTYSLEIVAGTTEKPTSVYKKKEAIGIAQAVGQFAKAAPGATLTIMLKLFEQAFPNIIVKKEEWDLLRQEVQATLQKGVSTGAPGAGDTTAGASGGPPQGQPQGGGGPNPEVEQLLAQADPATKEKAAQAVQSGASPDQIIAMLKGQPGNAGAQPVRSN